MSVSTDVTLAAVRADLIGALEYAVAVGLKLDHSKLAENNLKFYVTFENGEGQRFFVEFDCREYPLHPPTVEFVSEDHLERGTNPLYPSGFHPAPCICMRYNRKAYQERGGPPH
jgi:hypothetical protein